MKLNDLFLSLECRCRKKLELKVDPEELHDKKSKVVFCSDCYLNHRVEWKGDKPVVTLQYYFPDD